MDWKVRVLVPMESSSRSNITLHIQPRNAKQSVPGSQICHIHAITGLLPPVVDKGHATGYYKQLNSKPGSGLVLPVFYGFAGIVSLCIFLFESFRFRSNYFGL